VIDEAAAQERGAVGEHARADQAIGSAPYRDAAWDSVLLSSLLWRSHPCGSVM